MQRIAIVYKKDRPDAAVLADELKAWFRDRGVAARSHENIDESSIRSSQKTVHIPEDTELVVVLGGDGTFLSVARLIAARSTPIVGVNLGGLGFLAEIARDTCCNDLEQVLAGRYELEERLRLRVSIERGGREIFNEVILNDAVINKDALARIIDLETSSQGRYLTSYRADGLIVATPTGSTAYNLSAGGPIVQPTAPVIILTPICSFTLTNRPIVLPSKRHLEVKMGERIQDVTLTCDGQVGYPLAPLDKVMIRTSSTPLRLVKPPSTDYYEILRTKLNWGQNPRHIGPKEQ
jgi:NAD+ kinase